jgi:23S rRNA (adenine-N6)-dimethyltransferase
LIARINARFVDIPNVRIVPRSITSNIDFGICDVVFGNIPFNRTADVFRKVVQPPVRLESCHLIVQTEAAYRLLGSGRPTEMAVLAYPLVDVKTGLHIPRWAYRPATSVDSVVLHINTRTNPLISQSDYREFSAFVKSVVRSGSRKLSRVVGPRKSYALWRRVCAEMGINPNDSHLELSMGQYLKLFDALRR